MALAHYRNGLAGRWVLRIVGALIAVIGLVLTGGGAWLLTLGGSAYYLVAGIGLFVSGLMLAAGWLAGALVYGVVYLGTVFWSLWEVGPDPWPLLPRVFAPTVLLVAVLLVLPLLRPRRVGWRGAAASVAGVVVAAVIATWGMVGLVAPGAPGRLPMAAGGMSDPSLRQVGADWPVYGGTEAARRYSPLDQITAENVGGLERAWVFHTGDMPSEAAEGLYGSENTPLKLGDALYICTPKNIMIALDAATGTERWRYDPGVSDDWIPYTAACRGVAVYSVPDAPADAACATRIVEGTLDGRLIAVDSATGEPCADFGDNGSVDIKVGMGDVYPGMVSITSAPTIVRGVIVTGHQVLDGQERSAPSGVIQGFDAVTGALRWAWDMARPDITGLPPEGDTYTRGTPNMWTTATADETLGLVYLPMGNSAVDYWSTMRTPEENAYSTALVALDVTTGRPAWSFQTVRKDVWDYDLGSQATLVDFPTTDGTVPAVLLPTKQGDFYVLDRRTGALLTDVEDRPVPQGGVEPEERAPTQPFSLYHTLRKPELDETDMWGMSPIDQMACRIQFRLARYDGIYTPPESERHSVQYPGYNGGSDWGGVAVDPTRGVIVANYNDMPNYLRLVPREEANERGWAPRSETRGSIGGPEGAGDPQAGTPFAIDVNAGWRLPYTGLLCKEPPYGGIRAIALATGETLWDRPFGEARTNGPFGIPSMLPWTIGTPNNGGSVVTAGNVVFIAAATDNLMRAIDLQTGETLWKDVLPGGGQANPITYEANGRQYVVVMAGGHHFMETPISDALVAYALPQR